MVNSRDDAWDIAKAIGVGVFEARWVDLIYGGVVPTMACRLSCTVWHCDDGMGEVRCGGCERDATWKHLHGSDIDISEHSRCEEISHSGPDLPSRPRR